MPCARNRRAWLLPRPSRSLACRSTFSAISLTPCSLEKLVLAHKDLAYGVVREDVPDGVSEDRGDREHPDLVARLAPLQRQGIGDHDLLYRGALDPLICRAREDRVGRRGVNLRNALLQEALRRPDGGPTGVDDVVYHDGAPAFQVAYHVRHLRVSWLAPDLVHYRPRQAQVVRQALRHRHLPSVRSYDHRVLGVPEALRRE